MKVSSINTTYKNQSIKIKPVYKQGFSLVSPYNHDKSDISFGLANSDKLRILFEYGLPDMYTGKEMIGPKKFLGCMKRALFSGDARSAVKTLKPFARCFQGNEKKTYCLLKLKSIFKNYDNIQKEILSVKPIFEKVLVQKQLPIIENLKMLADEIPEEYQEKYNLIVSNAYKKIKKEPIAVPFSTSEFVYKMEKARADSHNTGHFEEEDVIIQLLRECLKLAEHTNDSTIENQKNVLAKINMVFENSAYNQNSQVKNLIKNAKDRLDGIPLIIPFTRKSFVYDLMRSIDELQDKNLKAKVHSIATKLPRSSNSFSAYLVKISKESPNKIAYRLGWPFFASVEHIHPQSLGGANEMNNYGGSTTKENADRGNQDFLLQVKRRPNTPKNCQKYINRLLLLKRRGIFSKHRINSDYIQDFANAVMNESRGTIKLSTTEPWYYKFFN